MTTQTEALAEIARASFDLMQLHARTALVAGAEAPASTRAPLFQDAADAIDEVVSCMWGALQSFGGAPIPDDLDRSRRQAHKLAARLRARAMA